MVKEGRRVKSRERIRIGKEQQQQKKIKQLVNTSVKKQMYIGKHSIYDQSKHDLSD